MSRIFGLLVLAVALLPLTAGCSSPTVVSGSVTYEEKPIEKGWITFLPADGQGATAGAEITGGSYQVKPITPGTKLVQIIGVKSVPFARSSEEMAQRAAAAAKQGDTTGIIDRADEVPANAVGNNAQIEIKSGSQKLDFKLKKPEARR